MKVYSVTYGSYRDYEVYTETKVYQTYEDARMQFNGYLEDVFDDYHEEMRVDDFDDFKRQYCIGDTLNIMPDVHDVAVRVTLTETELL